MKLNNLITSKNLLCIVCVLVVLIVLSGCWVIDIGDSEPTRAVQSTLPPTAAAFQAPAFGNTVAGLEGTLQAIYAQVNPSVVNIQVLRRASTGPQVIPEFPFGPGVPETPQPQGGLGSGFVWDKDGHIVTNNHVVAGAEEISVTFADGAILSAELIGVDSDSDLAVIQVELAASRLHPVLVADSTRVSVGELAVAIGNPFGLEGTMTVGIISALGRSIPVPTDVLRGPVYSIPDIIQTDAPINPGNSGGVLVDDTGRVIGVTAAIESPVRANAGIGFAIPSAILQKVVPALIETGSYEHPWLGISGTTLVPELARAMDLDLDQRGALVIDVTSRSPAAKAGLRGSDRQIEIDGLTMRVGGDIILEIDGQPVDKFDHLVTYLAREAEVGDSVRLDILRDGDEKTIRLVLEARPSSQQGAVQREDRTESAAYLGIVGLTLMPEIARTMDLPADQEGILVEQVIDGSPAEQAGLRGSYQMIVINGQQLLIGGDVIVEMEKRSVDDFGDLLDYLEDAEPGMEVRLTVLRDGDPMQLEVTLGERPDAIP